MSMATSAKGAKIKGYMLVRDKFGKPKVDDVSTLPPQIIDTLSQEDKDYLGITDTAEEK